MPENRAYSGLQVDEGKRYRAFCVAGYTKGGVQEKAAIRYKIRYQLFIPDL